MMIITNNGIYIYIYIYLYLYNYIKYVIFIKLENKSGK